MKVSNEMYQAGVSFLRMRGTSWSVDDLFKVMFNKLPKPIVIEDASEGAWGLSFDGHNPSDEKFVKCSSKDDAFKLLSLIS